MALRKKVQFVIKNPLILYRLYKLRKELKNNKAQNKFNFIFQCDVEGLFPYLEPYYKALKTEPNIEMYFSGNDNANIKKNGNLLNSGVPESRIIKHIELVKNTEWDVYMSSTSWGNVFPKNSDCARIQIFHTLADKNIQYGGNLLGFNVIFVCGPIHHELLKKYLFMPFPESRSNIKTYNVGYAKIDDLFVGRSKKRLLKTSLSIHEDNERKIILYAPNWERTSALHKYGEKVFDILVETNYIILVKLHYMSLLSPANEYATGGIDWSTILNKYQHYENVKIIYDQNINPYLLLADLLITDYGGVALEYMCTEKPIVYLDCPEFFEMRGKEIMEYWSRDTGYVVSNVDDIPKTIDTAFSNDKHKLKLRRELVNKLLYNPGRAMLIGKKIIINHLLKR